MRECLFLALCLVTVNAALLPPDAGCAMAFKGGQQVLLTRQGQFNFSSAFTLESWVLVAQDRRSFHGGAASDEMCVQGSANGPLLSVVFNTSGADPLGAYSFVVVRGAEACKAAVPAGDWHHVAATWDGSTASLYVDGVLRCTHNPTNAAGSQTSSSYAIGALPDLSLPFKGSLDEVRLWNSSRAANLLQAGRHRHVGASEPDLEVDMRFDECSGEYAQNQGSLNATGELVQGSVGGVLDGGVISTSSAPAWVASGAPIFGSTGNARLDLLANNTFTWDLSLDALDDSSNSVVAATVTSLTPDAGEGSLTVAAKSGRLSVEADPSSSGTTGGGEHLLRQSLILGSRSMQYNITSGSQSTSGNFRISVLGNRAPNMGCAGGSLSFPRGTYAGALNFKLPHRGTPGRSGANHSAKLTVEFWSKNTLEGLSASGKGTCAVTIGNSEDNVEAWSPETCGLDGGCHGRGSIHMPWSVGFPWTFFHYGITHLPMSAQLPCRWAHHSGSWQHVAFVADPDTAFHGIYFNGHLCNPGSQVDGPTNDLNSIFLGVWPILKFSADVDHHAGEVDEMRIWSSARTQEQIRAGMFSPPTAADVASGDLLASWSFDDCGLTDSSTCSDSSGNGNDLLFAVCGKFQDQSVWDGFMGPGGPNSAPCRNLSHPEEVHSTSWPTKHSSHAPINGQCAPIQPRTLQEDTSRRLENVLITATDLDADDRLELEFVELPPSIGTFFFGTVELSTGSRVPMQPLRPLVHGVTLRVEDLPRTAGLLGQLRVRALDSSGSPSAVGVIDVRSHMAGPGQEFDERLGKVRACARGFFATGAGGICQKCPSGTFGPKPESWQESAGNSECLACPKGTVGFESGLSRCNECEAGRFTSSSGMTSCASCPQGTFANTSGSSVCLPCLQGTSTANPGAMGSHACVCDKGTFIPCSRGHFNNDLQHCSVDLQAPVGSCQPCPPGMWCPGGSVDCPAEGGYLCPTDNSRIHAQPLVQPGHYICPETPHAPYLCWHSVSCPGQAALGDRICAPFHEGINCGRCQPGRYLHTSPDHSDCHECSGGAGFAAILLVLSAWVALGAGLWLHGCLKKIQSREREREAVGPHDFTSAAVLHDEVPAPPAQELEVIEHGRQGTPSVEVTAHASEAPAFSAVSTEQLPPPDDEHFQVMMTTASDAPPRPTQGAALDAEGTTKDAAVQMADHQAHFSAASFLSTCFGDAMSFLQRLSILSMVNFQWPFSVQSLLERFASFFLDLHVGEINAHCILGTSFEAQYLGYLVLPASMWLLGLLWYLVYLFTGKNHSWLSPVNIQNALGLLMLVFYTFILVNIFSLLDCYTNPNGNKTLRRYPFVICGDMAQLQVAPAFILAVLLYVCGFLSACIYLLAEAPKRYTCPEFRAKVNFLTFKYNPGTYWYGMVVAARSLCFSVVTTITPEGMMSQFWLLAATVVISLVIYLTIQPLRSRLGHVLEVSEQCVFLAVLGLGISFRKEPSGDSGGQLLAYLIVTSIIGYLVLLTICIVFMAMQYFRPQWDLEARMKVMEMQRMAACLVLSDHAQTSKVISQAVESDLNAVRDLTNFWILECAGLQQQNCLHRRIPFTATSVVPCDQSRLDDLQACFRPAQGEIRKSKQVWKSCL